MLVVGASASGLQLADEIHRSGRRVMLAVGEHIRMPRTYRGRDIQRWLDAVGVLDERYDAVDDIVRARRVPSSAHRHAGTRDARSERADVSAASRSSAGSPASRTARPSSPVPCATTARWPISSSADCSIASTTGSRPTMPAATSPPPSGSPRRRSPQRPRLLVDLEAERIGTVLWATGFRPDYRWLQVPVFDRKGRLKHDGGIVDAPGLYALGLNFMRRRKSSFIHGAEDDVREIGDHLVAYLRRTPCSASPPTGSFPALGLKARHRVDSAILQIPLSLRGRRPPSLKRPRAGLFDQRR